MSRVLLVQPPILKEEAFYRGSKTTASVIPPLGIAHIAAYLMQHGHECDIIDGVAQHVSAEKIAARLSNYDAVGITVVSAYAMRVIEMLHAFKQLPNCPPLVVGGPHATALPESLLEEGADYAVVGEGEVTMLELVAWLSGSHVSRYPDEVKGLAFFNEDGKTVRTPGRPRMPDLDTFPMPARQLLPMHLYGGSIARANQVPSHSLMASRGCNGCCTFCSHKTFGSKVRYFSAERIVDEIMLLCEQYGANDIQIWDDNFVANEDCVRNVCEQLRRRGFDKTFSVEARVDSARRPVLEQLKEAGCDFIAYGFESGSQRILDFIRKRETIEQMREAVALTKEVGIPIRGYFMIGFPTETREEMEATIHFAKELDIDVASFTLMVPLPGTADYLRAQQSGQFDPLFFKKRILPEFNFPDAPLYVTDGMSAKELLEIHRSAYNRYYFRPKIVFRRLAKLRGLDDVTGLLRGGYALLANLMTRN